jgi:hypothetical protein
LAISDVEQRDRAHDTSVADCDPEVATVHLVESLDRGQVGLLLASDIDRELAALDADDQLVQRLVSRSFAVTPSMDRP